MDAAQWPQDKNNLSTDQVQERKARPQNDQALNCPRCNSTNTKFCYYNNYSLSQPRYFCKGCRRYWTQGGSLRNVPVGGGSRKNRRSVSSASSASPIPIPKPHISSQSFSTHKPQDLSLAFQSTQQGYLHNFSQFLKLPKIENSNSNLLNFLSSSSSTSTTLTSVSSLDLLRTGITSDGLNSFNATNMSNSNTMFNMTGFSLQEAKATGRFPFQGNGIGYGSFQGNQENGGRIMLPTGVFNQQIPLTKESSQNTGQGNSTGYWDGTFGGGQC